MATRQKLTMSYECKESAMRDHKHTSKHEEVEIKRLKIQIDEFLSMDDWMWEDALMITFKIDDLLQRLKTYKEMAMQAVYDKKLSYALGYETRSQLFDSFALARDSSFNKLSCSQINLISDRVKKERKANDKQVKKLTNMLIVNTKAEIDSIVNEIFNEKGAEIEVKKPQIKRQVRQPEVRKRQVEKQQPRRGARMPEARREEVKKGIQMPPNEHPVVKINQIPDQTGSFNITVKVIKIIKTFQIKDFMNVEFQGGDQTGVATIVVSQKEFIKQDAVISISHARIFVFRGSKQIQMNFKLSGLYQENVNIDVNHEFQLSGRKKYDKREERGERQDRPTRGNRNRRNDKPTQQRGTRQERPPRQQRAPRQYRAPKQERMPRQERRPINRQNIQRRRPQEVEMKERTYAQTRHNESNNNFNRQQRYDRVPRKNKRQSEEQNQQENPRPTQNNRRDNRRAYEQEQTEEPQTYSNKKQQNNLQPANLMKIARIEPDSQDITVIAEIVSIDIEVKDDKQKIVKPTAGMIFCMLGDQTAVIRAELSLNNPAVKEGVVIRITFVNAEVNQRDKKITLRLSQKSKCERTSIHMTSINSNLNISQEVWQTDQEDNASEEHSQEFQQTSKKKPFVEDF